MYHSLCHVYAISFNLQLPLYTMQSATKDQKALEAEEASGHQIYRWREVEILSKIIV